PPDLRVRHPLLHGLGARPHRGPHRPRRAPEPVPGVGRRHGAGKAVPDLDGPGLGDPSGLHPMPPRGRPATHAPSPRRPYDGSLRRERAAETRDRIVTAGSELLRLAPVRDWRGLTVRAVAERAGVNERTVYRHFGNERGLRDAVMKRQEEEAGIDLEGMHLDD